MYSWIWYFLIYTYSGHKPIILIKYYALNEIVWLNNEVIKKISKPNFSIYFWKELLCLFPKFFLIKFQMKTFKLNINIYQSELYTNNQFHFVCIHPWAFLPTSALIKTCFIINLTLTLTDWDYFQWSLWGQHGSVVHKHLLFVLCES